MEQEIKPKFKFRWYHFLLIGSALLILVCIGGIAVVVSTPQFGQALQGAGQSLSELTTLQKQISDEFAIPPGQVGVFINFSTTNTNGTTKNARILSIRLTNSAMNELSPTDKDRRERAIAKFAHDHYAAAADVTNYCVVLIKQSQVSFFTSTQSENSCFTAAELGTTL